MTPAHLTEAEAPKQEAPWYLFPLGAVGYGAFNICDADGLVTSVAWSDEASPTKAARIVACVNACAGLADPAAEIASRDAEIARLKGERDEAVRVLREVSADLQAVHVPGVGRDSLATDLQHRLCVEIPARIDEVAPTEREPASGDLPY